MLNTTKCFKNTPSFPAARKKQNKILIQFFATHSALASLALPSPNQKIKTPLMHPSSYFIV